jgi:hypothetical protein
LLTLRRSIYTQKIREADKERDRLFQGFYGVVKSSQMQPEAAKQQATERLFNLLREYKKFVRDGNYAGESSALYNLPEDLRGKYAADLITLDLAGRKPSAGPSKTSLPCARNGKTKA